MVSAYTLTTFPNTILTTTAATKCKGKSNNNNQQTKSSPYPMRNRDYSVFSICISRSCTEIFLSSSRVWAHLLGYPWRLAKICGCILASSYCSRKVSTSKHQSVYVTSAPGSVNLKISISNLAGANSFFSLLPLQPLHWHRWPVASLAVE